MTAKIYEYTFSVGRGFNRAKELKEGWTDGEVATKHGFVVVYAQGDAEHFYVTKLEMIKDGVVYVRTFQDKRYTTRGIKTKAIQFANELYA